MTKNVFIWGLPTKMCIHVQFVMCSSDDYLNICQDKWIMCINECSSCFTPVWVGPRGPPHCPPSGLMTPPAGWDPPSIKTWGRSQLLDLQKHITDLLCLCVCGVWCVCLRGWIKQTSSKNCCVRRRMCLSSVSSRKFFFSASWLVLISFSSFSSFSKVACQSRDTHCYAFIYSRLLLHLLLQCFGI